tara:strand:- start:3056 stop:3511 length:456 start_codon:yes stop_codon:yes gene_type:complete
MLIIVIMIFNYCIWLTTEKNNDWRKITNEFLPHMSIKTNFKCLEDAQEHVKSLDINLPIIVELKRFAISEWKGFWALEGKLIFSKKNKFIQPRWWPDDPHVSFIYQYNNPIKDIEIEKIKSKIKSKECVLDKIKIMKCNYHHKGWYEFPVQ